jgi:hypothetical protein
MRALNYVLRTPRAVFNSLHYMQAVVFGLNAWYRSVMFVSRARSFELVFLNFNRPSRVPCLVRRLLVYRALTH